MGLLETVVSAAGTLSFKVKNLLGVYDRQPFVEDPLTPKDTVVPPRPNYGKGSFWGVTAQMNNINFDTRKAVDKINDERKQLDSQELKIQRDLLKAKTDEACLALNEQLNAILIRRVELNQQESETRSELKRVMDLIRRDYNLPPDCDNSDPHWRV